MGLLQNIFGEYTGDPGFIPEDGSDFDTEIKIEQQVGEPSKRTVIRRPQSPQPQQEPDLQALGVAFNPLELWAKVSKVVDAEMMTQEESDQKAQQIGEMAGGWPDVQQDTGVPTTPPMPPGGPIPHIMDNVPPQGMPPGQPPGDPTAGMPYPPSVFPTSDMPGNPHELGGRPPFNQGNPYQGMEYPQVGVPQGSPPGQPPADPTAGYAGPNADMSQPAITPPPFGAAGGMEDVMSPQDEGFSTGAKFTPEETAQRIKSGEGDQDREKTEAAIATAAQAPELNNNAGGEDASTDPMMWKAWGNLAQNPALRKADYLRKMNMLILGGIMLDAMASAMGVESESGRYIEAQLKMMEAEQKFDDQSRIYELGRAIYYDEEGRYNPPGSQKEAFDRLIRVGASIEEASALSGKHPETKAPTSYKEYWKIEADADGTHDNIFLPNGTPPPPGYTGQSPINALGDSTTSDMRNLGEIRRLKAAAAERLAAGDIPGARRLNEEAEILTNMTGGAAKVNSLSDARQWWTATHGAMSKQAASDGYPTPENTYRRPGDSGEFIPWPIFQAEWLESEFMNVKNSSGKDIRILGYRGIVNQGKTSQFETNGQTNALEQDMDAMRSNLAGRIKSYPPGSPQIDVDITSFIKAFGIKELPVQYGGEFE